MSAGIFIVNALTPGVAPNPGHLITELAPPTGCADGQVLQFIDEINGWGCVDNGGWSQSGSNIYYNSGNVGIGTSTPSERLDLGGGNIEVGYAQVNKHCGDATNCMVNCPSGTYVIGGGCEIYSPSRYTTASRPWFPPESTWYCESQGAGHIYAWAICANVR